MECFRLEEEDEEDEDGGSVMTKDTLVDEGLYDMADVPVVTLSDAFKDQLQHISSDEITQKVINSMYVFKCFVMHRRINVPN